MVGPRTPAAERRGFTLVELLVVILIIAILMGLLMVALKGVRQRASETNCLQNLHQIGVAMRAYTDKYKGMLPSAEAWGLGGSQGTTIGFMPGSGTAANLRPINAIINNDSSLTIFECPSDKGVVGRNEASAYIAAGSSYAYVARGAGWPSKQNFGSNPNDTPSELGPDIQGVGSDIPNGCFTGISAFQAPGRKLVIIEPSFYLANGTWDISNEQNQRHNIRNETDSAGVLYQQGTAMFLDWSARYVVRSTLPNQWTTPPSTSNMPHWQHDWY